MKPQSTTDKLFMRGKDTLLFLVSSGAIISLVHIWETPKKVDELAERMAVNEAFASGLDKKQAVMESNLENQTKLINMMQTAQTKIWERIDRRIQ